MVRKRRNFDKAVEKAQETNKQVQERMQEIEDYEVEMAMRKKRKPIDGTEGSIVANLLEHTKKQPSPAAINTV